MVAALHEPGDTGAWFLGAALLPSGLRCGPKTISERWMPWSGKSLARHTMPGVNYPELRAGGDRRSTVLLLRPGSGPGHRARTCSRAAPAQPAPPTRSPSPCSGPRCARIPSPRAFSGARARPWPKTCCPCCGRFSRLGRGERWRAGPVFQPLLQNPERFRLEPRVRPQCGRRLALGWRSWT